jgi:hypothetical protein
MPANLVIIRAVISDDVTEVFSAVLNPDGNPNSMSSPAKVLAINFGVLETRFFFFRPWRESKNWRLTASLRS